MYVIAEAGINHNGDTKIAKEMIDVATEAGCDAVKFQCYIAKNLIGLDDNTLKYTKKAEFGFDELNELMQYSNIDFLCSAYCLESIDIVDRLGIGTFKIPSGFMNYTSYLKKIKAVAERVILSTGMAKVNEILEAIKILDLPMVILHCISAYPPKFEEMSLLTIKAYRAAFQCPIGLSDHTLGYEMPIAACALGAEALEKHFTMSRKWDGPDHKMSTEPDELKEIVQSVRKTEKSMMRPGHQGRPVEVTSRKQPRR